MIDIKEIKLNCEEIVDAYTEVVNKNIELEKDIKKLTSLNKMLLEQSRGSEIGQNGSLITITNLESGAEFEASIEQLNKMATNAFKWMTEIKELKEEIERLKSVNETVNEKTETIVIEEKTVTPGEIVFDEDGNWVCPEDGIYLFNGIELNLTKGEKLGSQAEDAPKTYKDESIVDEEDDKVEETEEQMEEEVNEFAASFDSTKENESDFIKLSDFNIDFDKEGA